MLVAETVVRPHPSVVFTRLDDTEAVLLHLETKRYYSLNETGARIWELLQDDRNPKALALVIQDEYDIEHALDFVLEFLAELDQEGLVQTHAS